MPSPPSTAVSGTSVPKARKLSGGFQGRSSPDFRRRSWITETWAIVKESIAPNEYSVARKSVLPGIRVIDGDHREDQDRDVGGAVLGVDLAQALGQLAVLAHRVGEAGDADQAGVGGDQQDHRGEDADVEAQRFGQAAPSPRFSTMPRIGSLANFVPSAVVKWPAAFWVTGIAESATTGISR